MPTPLVSIIVSCYNAEKYISETLKSLVNQTYSNIEIVVVNDGSTDGSAKMIKSIQDERIKYYYQENKGQCAALNYGFSKSSGSLIKFYDSDDILYAPTIEAQVESLNGKPDTEISFIEWQRFFNDTIPASNEINVINTIHRNCSPVEYLTFGYSPMLQCGIWLIPRTLLLRTGVWKSNLLLGNDTELFTRVLSAVTFLHFAETGYTLYRTNFNSSMSSDFSKANVKSTLMAYDYAAKNLLKIENSDRIRQVIFNSYTMLLEWSYPKHLIYSKILERRLKSFPDFKAQFRKSGRMYNVLMKVFGWKVAKQLASLYYKIRYRH